MKPRLGRPPDPVYGGAVPSGKRDVPGHNGAAEGDKFRYKPAPCSLFPLERDDDGAWYVRQHGYKGEKWDLFCLAPGQSAVPAEAYAAAAVPFTVSLGLWLSVRCRTVTRAVLWLLPAIGGLTLFPVAVWVASDANDMVPATAAMALAALAAGAAALLFWRLAVAAFENEGRN